MLIHVCIDAKSESLEFGFSVEFISKTVRDVEIPQIISGISVKSIQRQKNCIKIQKDLSEIPLEKPNSRLSYFSSMYTCINMYMYNNNANFQKK
jgi:hypothetical protein